MIGSIVVLHAFATVAMVGVIWFVQLVYYPLMAHIHGLSFPQFEVDHQRRTTWVFAPQRLTEATTATILLFVLQAISPALAWLGIASLSGVWFRQQVLEEFSGVLCVDEIHLGQRVVLLASDPRADNSIACALVSRNDAAHMQRFLQNLKNQGFSPNTVITDRSPLYPLALQAVRPEAQSTPNGAIQLPR